MSEAGTVSSSSVPASSGWLWLPLSVLVVILDQVTKLLVLQRFELYERLELLPVLDFTLMYNTGAAFSFLADADGWQRWFFAALALVVGVVIVVWMRKLHARLQWMLSMSLALILGGAIGNVLDRIRLGHVVDFIHAHWKDAYFPAFNIADSAITIGAILLLLDAWRDGRRSKEARS